VRCENAMTVRRYFCGALLFNGIPDSSRDIRPAGRGRGADNASAAIRLRLAMAASRQAECPTNRVKLFQLAGRRLRGQLRLVGNGIALGLFALGLLIFRLPNCGRGGFVPMSTRNAWRNDRRRCSRQQLCQDIVGLRQFGIIGCRRNVSDAQRFSIREIFLSCLCADGAIDLRTNDTGSIGGIEVTKRKPE
jgi:hypothetical protein